jgi:hypothetical protein
MAKIDLTLVLRILLEIQAEQRTMRDENARISQELATKAGRGEILLIINRISEFEARMESRLDAMQEQIQRLK